MAAGRHKKALFYTPNTAPNVEKAPDSSTIINKVQLDQDIKHTQKSLKKELHVKQIKHLRKIADELPCDQWKYQPIDSLIGFK
ncbi:hypothetical protein CHUAL_002457 [Chamberlinius hualienensis]